MLEPYYTMRRSDGSVAVLDKRTGDVPVVKAYARGIIEAMEMAERIVKMLNGDDVSAA